MKKLLMLLAGFSVSAYAEDFIMNGQSGSEFRLHTQTVAPMPGRRDISTTALWTLTSSEKTNFRAKVDVTGCNQTSGEITINIIGHDQPMKRTWVSENVTMFDGMATVQCVFYTERLKKNF